MSHDQADAPKEPALSGSTELADVLPKGNILIVDDTPANLRLLAKMLAEQGYRVRPVPDGSLALAAARAEPPDLILLDIRMPGMNGYEVCEHLKADAPTRDIPIVFISALGETQDKVKAFTAGGVDYVTKPFQVEEVLARVETHLALRKLQKQLQDANKKMARELALAGEVQTSFLPRELPDIPGWQLSVTLKPSRETSGDFYDFDLLPEGRLGILVADVVDKGAGAALFMALSWILLRTYAAEYPTRPELVLGAVNRRILKDTKANQFVTVFYGILDPSTGTLVYGNAGHCPPYLISARDDGTVQALRKTGMALGVTEDVIWEQEVVQLVPGDVLVLYTDGITDAEDGKGTFFGQERLLGSVQANLGRSAQEMQDALMAEVHEFVGDAPQFDDIALMVVVRDSTEEQIDL
jgi:sigma-B regulation protein RsbU (phosphoserine phosphatase)